uniref:Uncharacterized protein n=1 Tax=Emiliania huxleyi (strain CCMP1516) TaxID=280463 RepID=A0A0D3JIS7_EMIH1
MHACLRAAQTAARGGLAQSLLARNAAGGRGLGADRAYADATSTTRAGAGSFHPHSRRRVIWRVRSDHPVRRLLRKWSLRADYNVFILSLGLTILDPVSRDLETRPCGLRKRAHDSISPSLCCVSPSFRGTQSCAVGQVGAGGSPFHVC